jgi:restriction system protein
VIQSEPQFEDGGDPEFRHFRTVNWLRDVPRSEMDKDILYSLGAIMTICEIRRNDAEARIRKMLKLAPSSAPASSRRSESNVAEEDAENRDYEQLARDEIAAAIIRRFKGHDLERLVDAILRAQGYVTHHSPTGPDGGVDILAGSGHLGFGSPKICVQVKSEQSPIDSPKLNQLLGTMQAVGADQGLLVSWGGFKSSIDRLVPQHFFKVRLWIRRTCSISCSSTTTGWMRSSVRSFR